MLTFKIGLVKLFSRKFGADLNTVRSFPKKSQYHYGQFVCTNLESREVVETTLFNLFTLLTLQSNVAKLHNFKQL